MSGIQSISVSAAQTYATVSPQNQPSLQPFANLDLTESQRTQIRSIFNSAKQSGTSAADVKSQIDAVLTPAQQQTLSGDLKARGAGHKHHHEADSSSQQSPDTTDASTQASTSATSADTTLLDTVTNIQNQVAAAQSTLVENLGHQIRSTNTPASLS